jgi:hypothetical protein
MYVIVPIVLFYFYRSLYSHEHIDAPKLSAIKLDAKKRGLAFPEEAVLQILFFQEKLETVYLQLFQSLLLRVVSAAILILITRFIMLPLDAVLWNSQAVDILMQGTGACFLASVVLVFFRTLPKPTAAFDSLSSIRALALDRPCVFDSELLKEQRLKGQCLRDLRQKKIIQATQISVLNYEKKVEVFELWLPAVEFVGIGFFIFNSIWVVVLDIWPMI